MKRLKIKKSLFSKYRHLFVFTLVVGLLLLTACQAVSTSKTDQAQVTDTPINLAASISTASIQQTEAVTPSPSPSDEPQNSVSQAEVPENEDVSIVIMGDILLGDTVYPHLERNGFEYPYREIKPILEKADVAVGNLEFAVTTRGVKENKTWTFRAGPEVLPAMVEAGFDAVSLANNHAIDYGRQGLLDTLDNVKQAGMGLFGAGQDEKEAYSPWVIEKGGKKFAFLGFSRIVRSETWKATPTQPGVAETHQTDRALAAIGRAKENNDVVIVYPHWGTENTTEVEPYQHKLAQAYIDAGADLVIGAHPHMLQGLEQYKGKWIMYSLGNFIFQTIEERPLTWDTVILEAKFAKDGQVDLKLHPFLTTAAQPKKMSTEAEKRLFQRLTDISFDVKVNEDGTVSKP
ncbi:CapA family protein [Paenibacillus albiflavus]|uniref:CapA family protein n=1 Tax=Paenibacillus albiflavus TaxID=2545760 RepID=A0A4R4DY25_9BACL|nr:CapA family protein [Paenibacillus albiflavus]TCZ70214.1 CapA family protein [Paenibacillus albiflavus]